MHRAVADHRVQLAVGALLGAEDFQQRVMGRAEGGITDRVRHDGNATVPQGLEGAGGVGGGVEKGHGSGSYMMPRAR